MSRQKRAGGVCVVFTLVSLAAGLIFLFPCPDRANPLPQQIVISEFSVQPDAKEKIELYFVNIDPLQEYYVETDYGVWQFRPDLEFPDTGFVILTDSSVVGDLQLSDTGGFIRIYDNYDEWAVIHYGDQPESVVPAPKASQSASVKVSSDEYHYQTIEYYYLDSSPTFGGPNDLAGAWGTVHGIVTDSLNGLPVEGAVIMSSDSMNSVITDSAGDYELSVVAGFPVITVTAAGYRSDASPFGEITLLPDSSVTHDVMLSAVSGIETSDRGGQSAPRSFSLSQNYPNPFNPSTTIHFVIGETGRGVERMSLVIFDMRGKRIRILVEGQQSPGPHTVGWDGRNDNGVRVGSGIYLYRLQVGSLQSTRRMVILK